MYIAASVTGCLQPRPLARRQLTSGMRSGRRSAALNDIGDALGPIQTLAVSISPSRSLFFPTLRSCRTRLGVARLTTFGLPKPSSAIFSATVPATVRLRRHASTRAPPAHQAQHETQKTMSTTTEPVGQSGRRYLIERVLQERGTPPRRVYLATYVLLKLNCQHYLTC